MEIIKNVRPPKATEHFKLISEIQISGINLIKNIRKLFTVPVGDNHIAHTLENINVINYTAVKEVVLFKCRFVNNNLNALGFYKFPFVLGAFFKGAFDCLKTVFLKRYIIVVVHIIESCDG